MSTDNVKLVTPTGRVCFTKNIFEQNSKGKFTACLVFNKDQDLSKLKDAMLAAAKAKFEEKIYTSKKFSWGLKESDADDEYEFLQDKMILNASTKFDIEVKGTNKGPDGKYENLLEDDFKAGDHFRAVVSVYAWEFTDEGTKRGVSFNIVALQKIKEGEAFYSRVPSDDIFADVEFDLSPEQSAAEAELSPNDGEVSDGGDW